MKKICLLALFFHSALFSESLIPTEREQLIIDHVKICIKKAEHHISQLNQEVLQVDGMSSPKVRHFLNNLCSRPDTHYLEIGCWKGSTLISSLFNNRNTIVSAIAIDNWSNHYHNERLKDEFHANCNRFLLPDQYHFYEVDCFKITPNEVCPSPVNTYFYDGEHTALDQELAFTYYNDRLDDVFIAVIDDWNHPPVPEGTEIAFKKLNYQVLFQQVLPARWNGDTENWWNGLYVAVIRKS